MGLKWAQILAVNVLGVELIVLGRCYYDFHKMNTSQDHRKHFHETFPTALETFYWIAEFTNSNSEVRKNDYETWGINVDAKK